MHVTMLFRERVPSAHIAQPRQARTACKSSRHGVQMKHQGSCVALRRAVAMEQAATLVSLRLQTRKTRPQ